jgi:hypothetical protein
MRNASLAFLRPSEATETFLSRKKGLFLLLSALLTGAAGHAGASTLAVYPSSAAVVAGTEQVFQPQLSGVPDTHQVTYEVDGIKDGNATVGSVTSAGVYTAPKVAGAHQITIVDSSVDQKASATVNVFTNVSVNFGSRSTALHAVPANMFGAERMDSLHDAADLDLVKAGGINYARFYALIPEVFKTTTPDWPAIDTVIERVSAGGVKVMLQMYQTPPYLQPSPNTCQQGAVYSMPTNVDDWAKMAAEYVKHMDATFPGVVTDYEIWNEPNTISMCVASADRLPDYLKLYDAAGPLMRAQIKADHSTARVGGPATAGFNETWTKGVLTDSVASQNIDFLSYHDYMFGGTQLNAQWDTYTDNTTSVYQKTQNTGAGPGQTYRYAQTIIATGKQPQGKNIPVYNTEYNLNWAYEPECCRNSPTYAPVWNGLYIADLLNDVYSGAPNVISHLVYFAANAHPYFCLVGEIDSNMDCLYPLNSSPRPYPSYFAYQLFGAAKYLGLEDGGHMAESIHPGTAGNGMVVTAFFTSSLDAVVVMNPSQYTYTDLVIDADDTGIVSPEATLYRIVNGEEIESGALTLNALGGTSFSAAVTIEPYSVQAIAIRSK